MGYIVVVYGRRHQQQPQYFFVFVIPFIFSLQLALWLLVVLVETMMESKGPK